jgi:hypothetical protein
MFVWKSRYKKWCADTHAALSQPQKGAVEWCGKLDEQTKIKEGRGTDRNDLKKTVDSAKYIFFAKRRK